LKEKDYLRKHKDNPALSFFEKGKKTVLKERYPE